MRGAVAVSFNLNDLTVTQGEEVLILYQFNTALEQYRVNVACIEGMSPFDFPEVPVLESRNHTKTAWRAAHALPVGCVTRAILSDFMACERPLLDRFKGALQVVYGLLHLLHRLGQLA